MKRSRFLLRCWTSVCQKLPEYFEEKLIPFQHYVLSPQRQHGCSLAQIGNTAQTLMHIYMPADYTVQKAGSKDVKVGTKLGPREMRGNE